MKKKLYKSSVNKKICGVCGGIAEYFGIDATWVRLGFCVAAFCMSIGIWPYILCAIILPKAPEVPQDKSAAPAEVINNKCPCCGADLAPDDMFCPNCGQPVSKS